MMKSGTTSDPFADTDEESTTATDESTEKSAETTPPHAGGVREESIVDAIVAELEAVEDGKSNHLNFRDDRLAPLLYALEDRDDDRNALGDTFREQLGREPLEDYDKSDLMRLAIRVAIDDHSEHLDDLRDAWTRHGRDTV